MANYSKLPFIGIVEYVIDTESEALSTNPDNELIDNRYTVFVKPVDSRGLSTSVKCKMVNNASLNLPVQNEAVMCIPTNQGIFITDKFTVTAQNLNFDPATYMLSTGYGGGDKLKSIPIDENQKKYLKKQPLDVNPPFKCKVGSRYELGRNGQYLIFDYGKRIDGERESEGSFVKVGVRAEGNEEESPEDDVIYIAKDDKIAEFMDFSMDIDEDFEIPSEEMSNNGIGMKSDDLYFVGNRYVVMFSKNNFIIRSYEKIFLQSNVSATVESDRINLGIGAEQPMVKGNDVVKMMDEFISIIESMQTGILTSMGNTLGFTPNILASINMFKSKYLVDNQSPIHSKKNFVE